MSSVCSYVLVGLGQRHPGEQYLSCLRIVKTFGELEERRLTGTRGADNRYGLARVDCEAEIMQRRGIGTCRIVEFDLCEFERAERRLGEADRKSTRLNSSH